MNTILIFKMISHIANTNQNSVIKSWQSIKHLPMDLCYTQIKMLQKSKSGKK